MSFYVIGYIHTFRISWSLCMNLQCPLKCTNEYVVLALGEETAVQAVAGSLVWAFRRLKNQGDGR